MRDDLPTGTVTFLFSDVEGSTKLLRDLGAEAYADALAKHRRIVREACEAEHGVEVDTQGDAFFFAFPSAPGAVTAAQTMTDALAEGQIHLRIGLHTGTPLVTDEGYVGDDVHFAARVGASAHGGQVVLSQTTRALVDGLLLTDLGEHRLKDIEGAVPIYQLGDKTFPPLKTVSNTNLPRPASSFVGRERELAEVIASVERGTRLLTLTGPGGSGKTRLALEAAASLVPAYKAGVFWVGLASLREASLVTDEIAQALGANDELAVHIGEREMLLLLDNLEQVIDAAPALSGLVQACPNLTLFCTSRELLRVQGEVEYAVPPLSSSEAVALFCERSQLDPSNEIAELCARLDDLPLAVELAAARTKALSPAQILERLSDRLDLLRGGRDADARQQTLRATIAWSYDLLVGEEQRVFRAFSVFAGGFTLDAAEGVIAADLDALQSLVEKSLLRFANERY
jgi:predicted RNase H-like HicB family nuclease